PLVNFFLAGVLALFTLLVPSPFVQALVQVNLALGIFNLLPGFPMDGGRILRALLARKMSYNRATHIAVRVGQGTAMLLGLFGLVTLHLMLMFIAVYIFSAAQAELRMVAQQTQTGVLSSFRSSFGNGPEESTSPRSRYVPFRRTY
ncbi:MAG: site-2 protease family protein, partial [Planctomycetota bacterium]